MEKLLDNIDIIELKNKIPDCKQKLINFFSHFLTNKYKDSNLFKFLVDTLRHSFEHLYNFKQNKNLIINDIFKMNLNSILLNKLHNNKKSEKERAQNLDNLNHLNTSFYFDTKSSNISFESSQKISLENAIIFFSFNISEIDTNQEKELPLLLIFRKHKKKEKEIALKIFFKKAEKDLYKIYIAQQKKEKMQIEAPNLMVTKNVNYYKSTNFSFIKIIIFLIFS